MPRPFVHVVLRPLQAFLRQEAASGLLLLVSTVLALVWANLAPASYERMFEGVGRTIINDGLMTLFFLVVGMEIKRELLMGELDSAGKVGLPAIAAAGGMLVPALIFLAINHGTAAAKGWGIPIATDIAFSLGVLSLVGGRVPRSLLVFLTALAIFDDVGGIVVIAVWYGEHPRLAWLAGAAALVGILFVMERRRVGSAPAFAGIGILLWIAFHRAGIHPTMAGVAVGLCVPLSSQSREVLARWIRWLNPVAAYVAMPLFALANAGVPLHGAATLVRTPVALGVALGLFAGKLVGIFGFAMLAIRLGLAPRPAGATLSTMFGVSVLGGIGFTVSLFIATLAFAAQPELLAAAKLGVIAGSLVSAVAGFLILRISRRTPS
jgi:NhaA family Na+:H+ antiporter